MDRGEDKRAERIVELAYIVGLDKAILKRRPHELSGGQQQRVALARAMAMKPRLMLLDEPFSALDTGLRASMRKAVAELLEAAGITTILVTHDQAEALSFADQVAVMRDGIFSQVGTPRDLYLKPKDRMIAEFLGDAIILPAKIAGGFANSPLGRIAVDTTDSRDVARIMLRPEQIALKTDIARRHVGHAGHAVRRGDGIGIRRLDMHDRGAAPEQCRSAGRRRDRQHAADPAQIRHGRAGGRRDRAAHRVGKGACVRLNGRRLAGARWRDHAMMRFPDLAE